MSAASPYKSITVWQSGGIMANLDDMKKQKGQNTSTCYPQMKTTNKDFVRKVKTVGASTSES